MQFFWIVRNPTTGTTQRKGRTYNDRIENFLRMPVCSASRQLWICGNWSKSPCVPFFCFGLQSDRLSYCQGCHENCSGLYAGWNCKRGDRKHLRLLWTGHWLHCRHVLTLRIRQTPFHHRSVLGAAPHRCHWDTCAAEFKAETPYFYSTFDEENEAAEFLQEHDSGKKKIIVFGSGPIRIGQRILPDA